MLEGFAFGWSVAWAPGPINAEIARRALARGAGPAFAVSLGAASGDWIWALLTSLGAGLLLKGPAARLALGVVSTALLLALAAVFLRGAWHGWQARRADIHPELDRLDRTRAGYALGLGMALTSPWNMGFWLAVMGRPDLVQKGLAASLVVAGSVLLGALAWCSVLIAALTLLRVRLDVAWWEIVAKGSTGALMLFFAIRGAMRLASG